MVVEATKRLKGSSFSGSRRPRATSFFTWFTRFLRWLLR
jgi:hypothetical protein